MLLEYGWNFYYRLLNFLHLCFRLFTKALAFVAERYSVVIILTIGINLTNYIKFVLVIFYLLIFHLTKLKLKLNHLFIDKNTKFINLYVI